MKSQHFEQFSKKIIVIIVIIKVVNEDYHDMVFIDPKEAKIENSQG